MWQSGRSDISVDDIRCIRRRQRESTSKRSFKTILFLRPPRSARTTVADVSRAPLSAALVPLGRFGRKLPARSVVHSDQWVKNDLDVVGVGRDDSMIWSVHVRGKAFHISSHALFPKFGGCPVGKLDPVAVTSDLGASISKVSCRFEIGRAHV